MNWEIREATLHDLEQVNALENAIFGVSAWLKQTLRSELEAEHTYYVVATCKEVVASTELTGAEGEYICAYAGIRFGADRKEIDIQTVAVAADARGRGLGRLLLSTLIDHAKWCGGENFFLGVRADNAAAIALYEDFGFHRIGVRQGYYQPENIDAIVMTLSVRASRVSS